MIDEAIIARLMETTAQLMTISSRIEKEVEQLRKFRHEAGNVVNGWPEIERQIRDLRTDLDRRIGRREGIAWIFAMIGGVGTLAGIVGGFVVHMAGTN